MEPAERYYDGSFFALNDTNKILIDVRGRSFGRTSYWLNKAIKRAIVSNHRRVFHHVTELPNSKTDRRGNVWN